MTVLKQAVCCTLVVCCIEYEASCAQLVLLNFHDTAGSVMYLGGVLHRV
jgi:hypothetical protein